MGRKSKPKEDKKGKLSITVSTENYTLMEGMNKSQLINWLLEQHFNIIK